MSWLMGRKPLRRSVSAARSGKTVPGMKKPFVLTPRAEQDIEEIWEYIAVASIEGADRVWFQTGTWPGGRFDRRARSSRDVP